MATAKEMGVTALVILLLERYPKEGNSRLLDQARKLSAYYNFTQVQEMLAHPEARPRILIVESDLRVIKELKDQMPTVDLVFATDANQATDIYNENAPFIRMILVAERSSRRNTASSYSEWNHDIMRQLRWRFPGFIIAMSSRPDLKQAFQMGRAGCDDIIFPKKNVPSEATALLERQRQVMSNLVGGDWLGLVHTYVVASKIDGIDWHNCLEYYEFICRK